MSVQVYTLLAGMSNAHLVEFPEGMILVDAGSPGSYGAILRKMRSLGRSDLLYIFITHAHFDHYGNAKILRQKTGAKVAIHKDDASVMSAGNTILGEVRGYRGKLGEYLLPVMMRWFPPSPVVPDIVMQEGDRLPFPGINAIVMHTPGHTDGSSSLLINESLVFVGDLITSRRGATLQHIYAQNWDAINDSLKRVQSLTVDTVYTGHGLKPVSSTDLKSL